MKKTLAVAIVMALFVPFIVTADEAKKEEYMELCKSYAKDDEVSAEDMDNYLESCVKDLEESAAEAKD